MIEAALGIDVGTSGVRIAARGRDGALLAMAESAMAHAPTQSGRARQDPAIWWRTLGQAMARLDLHGLPGLRILAIAIDGTSGTLVPVTDMGEPVGLGSMYNDVAPPQLVQQVEAAAPAETAARGSTSPLARALAMGSARVVHQADWLMGQLCGRFDVTDENNALKSGYDPLQRQWPAWIGDCGFDVGRFPHVVPAGTRVGTILPTVAHVFGLTPDVAVVAGTTDGCAAFLASGAATPGDGVTSLGTTMTLKLLSATPVFAPRFGIYSHRIGETWLAGGASNSGGAALARHFPAEAISRLSALIDPARETGLDYYPLPEVGERFPVNDPNQVSRVTPRPGEDHVFLHGLLEGIAEIEALAYRRLAELGTSPLRSIRTVGGGAVNAAWTAIRLKKLGVPALPAASPHAAMGVARLAWAGMGHHA